MKIEKPTKFIESYLEHRLHPALTVEAIQAALPGIEDEGESGDGKVTHHWSFVADGRECAIWDFKGLRWSAYGPREVYDALGLEVIGDAMDGVKAWALQEQALVPDDAADEDDVGEKTDDLLTPDQLERQRKGSW